MPICSNCSTHPVTPPRRKYCSASCADAAIRRWKADLRRETLAAFQPGPGKVPPWKEGWASDDARKKWFREYRRRRRSQQRAGDDGRTRQVSYSTTIASF